MVKMLKRWWPLFLLPTALSFLFGFVVPFIQGLYLSFCKFISISDAKFIGFSNYAAAFADKQFANAFWYTALFVAKTRFYLARLFLIGVVQPL